jgi:PKHD-type hydroxylase
MQVHIPQVLTAQEVGHCRAVLDRAQWVDGKVTAGHQSARAKNNLQIPESAPEARQLGAMILRALERNPLFMSAVLPDRVFPPLFNRYDAGMHFHAHVDNAVRQIPGSDLRVRTDVSATLFLSDPTDYDGGELVIEDNFGTHRVKLPAGDMVVYPSSSLHRVEPITRGSRWASFFWIQSMVRDDAARTLLFDLDSAIQNVAGTMPDHGAVVQLTNVYHNLLRRWVNV